MGGQKPFLFITCTVIERSHMNEQPCFDMIKRSFAITMAALFVLGICNSTRAVELDDLQGKWKTERDIDGDQANFTLEIKDDQFRFQWKNSEGQMRLYAEGKVKVQDLGPFQSMTLYEIKAGDSPSDLEAVNDERAYVYVTGYKTLTMAGNFDKRRDNEQPSVIVYRKVD